MPALRIWLVAFLAVAFMMTGTASAEIKRFTATLAGSSEVPPTDAKGTGTATVSLNTVTKRVTWFVKYSGLEPVTAAHIHGPADPSANAGVVVPVNGKLASPIRGWKIFTDAQIADLVAGKDYINLHTDAHKGGAIRGQIEAGK